MTDGKTFGFTNDGHVRYVYVTSGSERMTMILRFSRGRNPMIETQMMIFKNKVRNYLIRGVPDNIPEVVYRTGPKGWMDSTNMLAWLRELRAINPLSDHRFRTLFIDNCSGHNLTKAILGPAENICTNIRYFPPNTTDELQPCDSFVIQKVKVAWRKRWEEYKLCLLYTSPSPRDQRGSRMPSSA